jgi:hypothetical protein
MQLLARAAALAAATAATVALSASVAAAQQSVPNGPWIQPEQEVRLEALTSNEGLGKVLRQIESRSRGRLEVETIGQSATGWPIYLAKLGEPSADKQGVFIQGQIHGDEPLGSEAAVQLIQELALSNSPQVEQILAETTIWIIPRLNMDGAAFEVDGELVQRRQNTQEWTPAEWGLAPSAPAPWYHRRPTETRPGGYDINRDFTPDLDFRLGPGDEALLPGRSDLPGFFVTPEARTSAAVFQRLQPDVFIDLHHRGTNTQSDEDNQMTTLQVIGDVTEGTAEFPLDPDARARSFQLNAYVFDTLSEMGNSPFTGITRYPDVELPGTALGSYNLNGAAIMLYETRSAEQKSNGMLTRQIIVGLRATLVGLVNGEIDQVDPDHYYDILPAGPRIGNPRF